MNRRIYQQTERVNLHQRNVSTQTWQEWNAPGAVYTATAARTDANWKNLDDSTTSYTTSQITAANNSFAKHQGLVYGGTWNNLSALTYKVSSATPGTGLSVVAAVLSALPTVSAAGAPNSALATGDAAASTTGTTANFTGTTNTTAGIYVAGTATVTGPGTTQYAQVYRTQLQTTGSAAPGDITAVTITAQWTES